MDEKILLENEKLTNEELTNEEVNIYADSCGSIKIHCLYDCINNTPWITDAN